MRISKHLINLITLSMFGLLVLTPFSLIRPKVDPVVLGVQSEKTHYKKFIGDSSKVLVRNLITSGNNEKDALTLTVLKGEKFYYYPIYEITNVTNTPLNFTIYPSSKVLGDMNNNVATLQLNNGESVTMFEYSNQISANSKVNFSLNSREKMKVTVIIDNLLGVDKDTLLSFDLTVEKN